MSKSPPDLQKFPYVWIHVATGKSRISEVECVSWPAFYKQLDRWNGSARGTWVYYSYGGSEPAGTILSEGKYDVS